MSETSRQVFAWLRRLLMAALLFTALGGCSFDRMERNLSNADLAQRTALALDVPAEQIVILYRRQYDGSRLTFDVRVKNSTGQYGSTHYICGTERSWFSLEFSPVQCGCYVPKWGNCILGGCRTRWEPVPCNK